MDSRGSQKRSWAFSRDATQNDWLPQNKRVNGAGNVVYPGYGNYDQSCLGPESLRANYGGRLPPQDDFELLMPGSSTVNDCQTNGFAEPMEELKWNEHIDADFVGFDGGAVPVPEEVCFGMVCATRRSKHWIRLIQMQLPGIEVRFNKGVDPVSTILNQTTETNFLNLGLSVTQNRCEVVAFSGEVVGALNMKSFRSLARVQQEVYIRFEGAAKLSSCIQRVNPSESNNDTRYCSIDILVFGYRHDAELVAANLAANDFFLQDPDHVPPGFSYENPQCLDLPDIPGAENLQTNGTIVKKALPTGERVPAGDRVQAQDDDFELDYDRLLDDFACHDDLVQATVVAQISTTLLRYATLLHLVSDVNALSATKEKAWISFCNVR